MLPRREPVETSPVRVFVASPDRGLVEAILSTPACELAGHVARPEHCLPILAEVAIDALVLAGDGREDGEALLLARHLRLIYPRLALAVVAPEGAAASTLTGLETLGVRVLPPGTPPRSVVAQLLASREAPAHVIPQDREVAAAADASLSPRRWLSGRASPVPTPPQHILTQQVVTVLSPKGGVGKTLVATNLAVAVATRTPARVVLADLDLNSSDVGVHLDLLEGPTVVDLLPYLPEVGTADLRRFLVTHRPSGVDVLLGPARPELAGLVKVEHLRRILDWLRREYHFVFLDTPPEGSSELIHECLQVASRTLLVTTTDAASLRQVRMAVDTLRRLGVPADRIILVVNQVHDGSPVTLREVQNFLELNTVVGLVADRRLAEEAVFEGKPLILGSPEHPLASALVELAGMICPGLAPEGEPRTGASPKRRLLGWLRRAAR